MATARDLSRLRHRGSKVGHMLRLNHGANPGEPGICGFAPGEHPLFGAMCTAQYLLTNHITYATRRGGPTPTS